MKVRLDTAPKVHISSQELKNKIDTEVKKQYEAIYRDAAVQSCVNIMGLVLFTLDKQYGFRKRRLWRFMREMQATDKLLNRGMRDSSVDNSAVLDYLKQQYYIDLEKELTRSVDG